MPSILCTSHAAMQHMDCLPLHRHGFAALTTRMNRTQANTSAVLTVSITAAALCTACLAFREASFVSANRASRSSTADGSAPGQVALSCAPRLDFEVVRPTRLEEKESKSESELSGSSTLAARRLGL